MEQVRPIMKQKRLPGPAGTSCLTCKRRRKKCDQGRPTCQRCAEGGYDCLGYDHIQQRKVTAQGTGKSRSTSIDSAVQASTQVDKEGPGGHQALVNIPSQPLTLSPYEFSEAPIYRPTGYITSADGSSDQTATSSCLSLVTTHSPDWNTPVLSSLNLSSEFKGNHPDAFHASDQHSFNLLNGAWIAQTLSPLSPEMKRLIHRVLNLYERVMDSVYFKPRGPQVAKMREMVVIRLQASSITRCAAILVVKMVEAMLNGDTQNNRATLKQSVERFENQLQMVKAQNLNSVEVQHLLNGFLEAAFLKIRVSNGFNSYQLLRNAAPTFIQIVYSDPHLWPDPSGPPMVCLSKVAASTRFELGVFALTDIICAIAYGLPQVVDYETLTRCPEPDVHPLEWVFCCPLEFQLCIAEMNQRCSRGIVAPDWHVIEHRLLSYKAPTITLTNTESWKSIARLAVAESWRQAVCGVSSDDPRVQSAVRQTFQLFKTVRREEPPKVNAHFMIQYLIAGACTRDEKQRAYARERLLDAFDNECWLLPGSELVPVLDHLWHGAAANGRPFKWSDYLMSRQVALPIPI